MSPAADHDEHSSSLLAAATAGDASAWRELFATLSPAVAGYLRVQGAHEVDDLVSEVFMGVFQRIARFEGSSAQFRSWVFVIAHHKLIDERRRRARLAGVIDDTSPSRDLGSGADAESGALDRMSADRVIRLCQRLVADQRDVLLLRLIGDLTIEQIAEIVGKTTGAVKALQRRGLAAMQKVLSAEGVPI